MPTIEVNENDLVIVLRPSSTAGAKIYVGGEQKGMIQRVDLSLNAQNVFPSLSVEIADLEPDQAEDHPDLALRLTDLADKIHQAAPYAEIRTRLRVLHQGYVLSDVEEPSPEPKEEVPGPPRASREFDIE